MLTATYDKLKALQVVLSKKCAIEAEMEEIPRVLTTKIELLNRLNKTMVDKEKHLEETKTRITEIKTGMTDAEKEREKSEQLMDQIKTQREYEALDKQIKDISAKELDFRKELQRLESAIEETKAQIDKEKTLIAKQEEEVKEEQAKIKHEMKEKQKVLKTLEKEETKITPGLDEDILFKFERIIKSKSGLGIVPIKNGICTGCYMILPAQFVNDVRFGQGIRFCPECSRILFVSAESTDESDYMFSDETVTVYSEEEDEEDDDDEDDDEEETSGGSGGGGETLED
ncbi:MAG: nucleic acid-binding protein [Spirochaetaceae bacterium]|nr:MAG: nucleic acid-binding protein [Spirochaetaceae bacterium]